MTTDMPLRHDSVTVVTLPGEVDLVSIAAVRDDLFSSLNRGSVHLVVDARATTFLDSTGINALVRVRERAERMGGSIHLVTASPPVRRVLALTQLDRVVAVVTTMSAALQCAGSPATIHTCRT